MKSEQSSKKGHGGTRVRSNNVSGGSKVETKYISDKSCFCGLIRKLCTQHSTIKRRTFKNYRREKGVSFSLTDISSYFPKSTRSGVRRSEKRRRRERVTSETRSERSGEH